MEPEAIVSGLREEAAKVAPLTVKRDWVVEPLEMEALAYIVERIAPERPGDPTLMVPRLTEGEVEHLEEEWRTHLPTPTITYTAAADTDEPPLPSWWNPWKRYWAWRHRCDDHGNGPHIYEYWGAKWLFLLAFTLEDWAVGIAFDHPTNDERYVTIHVLCFQFQIGHVAVER